MDTGIGAILRDARNRRKIDLSAVEAATQIRIRYLRAMENEEWDVLPEDVYTRGFIRTYASFLGLDGERLADDYRRRDDPPATEQPPRVERAPLAAPSPRLPDLSGRAWAAIVAAAAIAALVIAGLAGGGGGERAAVDSPSTKTGDGDHAVAPPGSSARPGVSMQLTATAEVWVCLLDADGQPLVDGQILESGAEEGPFHSDSFTVSFGNGEVSVRIDGKQADIAATASPIGYAIDPSGRLAELAEGERPTCT